MSAMANPPQLVDPNRSELAERNRRTVRVLLTIVALLVVATILVGIRW